MKTTYYLKCEHCQTLIEFHSQYMVLCSACGRKLSNSYSAWHDAHPDGTLQQYLDSECVSSAARQGLGEQRKIGRLIKRTNVIKRVAIAMATAIGLFLIIAVAMWFLRGVGSNSVRDIMDQSWKMNYYEDLNATVQFPFTLSLVVDTVFNVPDSVIQVKSIVARQWTKPSVCNITAMRMTYTDDKTVDRESATGQIFQSIVSDNGMQAFQYIPSDYMLGVVRARMMTGSYLIGAELYEFRAVLIVSGDQVWYFMVAYPASKPEGTMLAEKFFKTIQLN